MQGKRQAKPTETSPGPEVARVPLQHINETGLIRQDYLGIVPGIPPITKLKVPELITPIKSNKHADMVLFLLSLAEHDGEIHALARAIGSASGGEYKSRLLHGTMGGLHTFTFDETPIMDATTREDPRLTKIGDRYYFTNTVVKDGGEFSVGLASTRDFKTYSDHGVIIPPLDEEYVYKDPVLFPETVDGSILMQVRLKPGIQLVKFKNIKDLLKLGLDPEHRQKFWSDFIANYRQNNRDYDYLSPHMEEMRPFERRWKPALDELIDQQLLPTHPHHDILLRHPQRDEIWYGPGPSPLKTTEGWLDFPHRGQVVAEYSVKDKERIEQTGRRVENPKFYCMFATLHDLNDPRKLVAVSPSLISVPDPSNQDEMLLSRQNFSVPYVKIGAGSLITELNRQPYVMLPIGVHDRVTRLEYLPLYGKQGLIPWMLEYGRAKT